MKTDMLRQINAILTNVSKSVSAERSTVFLVDQTGDMLHSLVSQGIDDNLVNLPIGSGIAGRCAQTGAPELVNDVDLINYFDDRFDRITGYRTRKALCVPIVDELGRVVGVVQSLNRIDGNFTLRDQTVLRSFSDAIALALKHANLHATSEAVKNEIATLLRVSSSINSELDLKSLIQMIVTNASEITQSDRSSFFLLDREKDLLWTKFGEGLGSRIIKTRHGLAYKVAKSKMPLIENDPYGNPDFDKSVDVKMGYTTRCIISLPVFNAHQEVIGVIQSINKHNGEFDTQDLFILNGFASQISIAIQNSTLFEEISTIKNYLDILFENLNNGILTISKDGCVKTVNKRFCEILALQPEQLIGRDYRELAREHYSFFKYSEHTFLSGEKYEKSYIESTNVNQKKLVVNFNSLPMTNREGENIGVINVIDDITSEERVKENLNRYLPQHVINEIINNDDLSLFNGKYRKCSILFSDLRNFTSITEKLEAIEVVDFLNRYFDVMVDYVFEHNGVLDKLIGDAIMATFGIPYNSKNDAGNAINAGLRMIENLHRVGDTAHHQYGLGMGIGIATGNVISGNIGSTKRFEYTVIGDAVNLASRLEGLTKYYGVKILICEDTFQDVAHLFHCRELDCIIAKGKQEPVTIYTVVQPSDYELADTQRQFLEFYAKGLRHYRARNFAAALRAFRQAAVIDPDDRPSELFVERCRRFERTPPVSDWNGTWQFFQK